MKHCENCGYRSLIREDYRLVSMPDVLFMSFNRKSYDIVRHKAVRRNVNVAPVKKLTVAKKSFTALCYLLHQQQVDLIFDAEDPATYDAVDSGHWYAVRDGASGTVCINDDHVYKIRSDSLDWGKLRLKISGVVLQTMVTCDETGESTSLPRTGTYAEAAAVPKPLLRTAPVIAETPKPLLRTAPVIAETPKRLHRLAPVVAETPKLTLHPAPVAAGERVYTRSQLKLNMPLPRSEGGAKMDSIVEEEEVDQQPEPQRATLVLSDAVVHSSMGIDQHTSPILKQCRCGLYCNPAYSTQRGNLACDEKFLKHMVQKECVCLPTCQAPHKFKCNVFWKEWVNFCVIRCLNDYQY